MAGIIKDKMGGASGYTVGSERFRTKGEVTNRARSILYSVADGGVLSGDGLKFVLELLKFHKSYAKKIGPGVSFIVVRSNPMFPSNRGFWIVRTDGSEADFSFVECISPAPAITAFRSALRQQVAAQIIAFRENEFGTRSILSCPITGDSLTRNTSHIDHIPPDTFVNLVDRFVSARGLDIDKIELTGGDDGVIGDSLTDQSLGADWESFHLENAKLRVVSIRANLSDIVRGA